MLEEVSEFLFVKVTVGADAATEIEAERADLADSIPYVLSIEATCKVDGNVQCRADFLADDPIVNTPGTAEFFDSQIRTARIQQNGVDEGSNCASLL